MRSCLRLGYYDLSATTRSGVYLYTFPYSLELRNQHGEDHVKALRRPSVEVMQSLFPGQSVTQLPRYTVSVLLGTSNENQSDVPVSAWIENGVPSLIRSRNRPVGPGRTASFSMRARSSMAIHDMKEEAGMGDVKWPLSKDTSLRSWW
jgi:hypothetical protein